MEHMRGHERMSRSDDEVYALVRALSESVLRAFTSIFNTARAPQARITRVQDYRYGSRLVRTVRSTAGG